MSDAASAVSEPIEIDSERTLLQVLRARREQLQLSYESVAAVSGMPDQYPSRLLSGARAMGMLSFFLLLQTLGYKVQLVEDSAALEKNRRHSGWQELKRQVRSRIVDPDRVCARAVEWEADAKALERLRAGCAAKLARQARDGEAAAQAAG